MEGGTVFTPSLEGLKSVRSVEGELLTKPFLDVCKLILPIIGMHFLDIITFILFSVQNTEIKFLGLCFILVC